MPDVLLAHAYFLKHDPKQVQKMRPYPPLATLIVANLLRNRGYTVALFDAMLSDGEAEFEEALQHHRPQFVALFEDSFNFLSKMCLGRMRQAACAMSRAAKQAGATVLAAGSDVTDRPEVYLAHGTDFALLGEADHTLVELLDALSGPRPQSLDAIAGLALADPHSARGVRYTSPRTPERHPDVFPVPAWDLVDIERYRAAWTQAHGYFSLNLATTRGCPFHCNWCAKPIWGQRYAMRSPAQVADELAYVKQALRPDHIWFADDIFGLRPSWVAEFGRAVAACDARIPFTIQSRVDLITEEAVTGLAQAGCAEVWLGAESGSQRILDAMDKGTRVEEIRTARGRLKAAAIRACFFLQFGYPGETFEDILATVRLVRETLPDDIGISVSYPLPGTKFYELVREQLGSKTNWVDSGDLAMMFEGTYQSPFYRKLHTVVHRDLKVRRQLAERTGPVESAFRAEMDRLTADWLELDRLEVEQRSATPSQIRRTHLPLAAPDLSKAWN